MACTVSLREFHEISIPGQFAVVAQWQTCRATGASPTLERAGTAARPVARTGASVRVETRVAKAQQ